jgi:hypothetical protein
MISQVRDMTREEFITAAEIAFEKLMTPTRGIPPVRMEEPMEPGGWSLKDLAAHLAEWNTQTIRAVETLNQGSDPDTHASDDDAHLTGISVSAPPKRVMTELRLTHSTLTEAVRRISPYKLDANGEIPVWLERRMIEQYAKHTPQIEAWAERVKQELEDQK